ncbi:MAG: DUF262 domain-containing protein [Caldilineaceae bacterium]|nr:DUF262 domain-containing protein [Caldilineaceae bacterium]
MFNAQPESLKKILRDVSTGNIQLPDFQRGWVWDDDRITEILESVSRAFPVGAITTLSASKSIRLKPRLIEGVPCKHKKAIPATYVLDGQQRLTSLYQALLHPGPVKTQDSKKKRVKRWYYIDMLKALDRSMYRENAFISVPEDRITTAGFGRQIVVDLSTRELEYRNHMMPTEKLLNAMTWVLGYNDYWGGNGSTHPSGNLTKFLNDFNVHVIDVFGNYSIPVINLGQDVPKEAVCKVFEKVNTGGVTLTVFELVTASFAADSDEFRLRDNWDKRRERMRSKHGVLQGIEGEHFLQAIALLATNDRRKEAAANGVPKSQLPGISCKKETILNLRLADYQKWADVAEKGLEKAAKFLAEQFIFGRKDVPYSTQIIPLAVILSELGDEAFPARASNRLERWYWAGVFGEEYGSQIDTKFAIDLLQVPEYVRGGPEPTLITQSSFIPERLVTLRSRRSAAYKGLYALQMKSGASDWITGKPLAIAVILAKNIDIHHIFPKSWCRKHKPPISPTLFDSIINKTPIDAQSHKTIGWRGPSKYIPRLEKKIETETLGAVLKSHWLNPESLRNDDFAKCFVERGEAMLELIGEAMGKRIEGGKTVFLDALDKDGIQTDYIQEDDIDDEIGEILRAEEE